MEQAGSQWALLGLYLLCLEPVLQLEPQLVGLVLDDAGGAQAGPGLHAQGCVARALPQWVEVGVLHGRVAALRHLSLRRVLLREDRSLLLHQDARVLAGEGLWVNSLALQRDMKQQKQLVGCGFSQDYTRLIQPPWKPSF